MPSIDWGLAGNVVFSGMVIVFVVLIMLIALVTLTGRIMGGVKKNAAPAVPSPAPVRAAAPPAPSVPAAAASGNAGEVIAAISAAVAVVMDEAAPGAPYAIRSVSPHPSRADGARPVWGFAGMRQNTQPF